MAIDPICKMEVDEASAQWTSEHAGTTYYFCAPGCKSAFEADPHAHSGDHAHGGHGDSHAGHGH